MNMFLYDYLFTVWEEHFLNVILQNHARFFSSGAIIDFSVLFYLIFLFSFEIISCCWFGEAILRGCKTEKNRIT